MSSNIEIKKKCRWCGAEFIACKTTTEYCTDVRVSHTRKESVRQSWIHTNENMNISNLGRKK